VRTSKPVRPSAHSQTVFGLWPAPIRSECAVGSFGRTGTTQSSFAHFMDVVLRVWLKWPDQHCRCLYLSGLVDATLWHIMRGNVQNSPSPVDSKHMHFHSSSITSFLIIFTVFIAVCVWVGGGVVCVCVCCVCKRERDRQTETDRQTDRSSDSERQRNRQRHRNKETDRQRDRKADR